MAHVQLGDQEAFGCLLDRHATRLHAFLHRMIQNSADAEDLTQEAFLRVWRHADRWQPQRVKFTTWLYRIGHNLCIDRLRRRREVNVDEFPEPSSSDPTDDLDAERRSTLVKALIAELPERQRTALLLCHYQGLTNQQAAEVLDVSVDALESLLARARRFLRERLAPWLEKEEADT